VDLSRAGFPACLSYTENNLDKKAGYRRRSQREMLRNALTIVRQNFCHTRHADRLSLNFGQQLMQLAFRR